MQKDWCTSKEPDGRKSQSKIICAIKVLVSYKLKKEIGCNEYNIIAH